MQIYQMSWKDYFEGIGDELNIIAKEINGPSWGPKKNKIDIDELQKKLIKKIITQWSKLSIMLLMA